MPELVNTLIPSWRIDGRLTTLEPLRIGDGGVLSKSPIDADVASVFVDADRRAYLPGSSLRGFLRAYFKELLVSSDDAFKALFGFQGMTGTLVPTADALGGCVTVWDARINGDLPAQCAGPYWNPSRATAIASHVVMDRRTRTASKNLLFFEEYVPKGISFGVTLLLEGGELRGQKLSDLVGLLLAGLQRLADSPARAGASAAENWGRLKWSLTDVRRLEEISFSRWLNGCGLLVNELEPYKDHATLRHEGEKHLQGQLGRWLTFTLRVTFRGPFLVNDTSKAKGENERNSTKPAAAALRTSDGKPILPGSSLHGALRSQAERVARTLAGASADGWVRSPNDPGREQAIANKADLKKLDAVSCLFGAAGWQSVLRCSPLRLAANSKSNLVRQDFVAIDRFTGGGAATLKFDADAFQATSEGGLALEGKILFDVKAWHYLLGARTSAAPVRSGSNDWNELIYLLAYTLRDLCEGDIPLGMGTAKGYGACLAEVRLETDPKGNPHLSTSQADLFTSLFATRRVA